MKTFKNYKRIIATKENSAGNDTVGDMWTQTKSFDKFTSIHRVIEWGDCGGKLTITIDEDGANDDLPI